MTLTRERRAWLGAALVFLAAAAVMSSAHVWGLANDFGALAILLLPMAAYGVLSGRVSRLTAPGGWEAEFRQTARAPAETRAALESPAHGDELLMVAKGGLGELADKLSALDPEKPVSVVFRLGQAGYVASAMAAYLRAFLAHDPQLSVILVDPEGRFAASASAVSLLAALETPDPWQIEQALAEADLKALSHHLRLVSEGARPGLTHAQALETMTRLGVDALVSLDETGRPMGLVRRDRVMARLMEGLARRDP